MKKLVYIFTLLLPVFASAQFNYSESFPLDNLWQNVGNVGFSAGGAQFLSLAFSPSGVPYIAYQDFAYADKASVMKYDGTHWINVGNAGFSTGLAIYTSLAFSPDGQPYVAYEDEEDYYGKAEVKKYDGTNWVNVGNKGFSSGEAGFLSLAFNQTGKPYVAYQDGENSLGVTVMKYDYQDGINDLQQSPLFLYPNPFFDEICIETSENQNHSELSIINLDGQQIITRQITEPKTQLDIISLPSGIYFVRVTSERAVQVGKFIKQ